MAEEKKEEKKKEESAKENSPQETPSVLEWIVAGIGVLLVAGAIGFLIYRGATKADTPPNIKIDVESVVPAAEKYLVNFRISNTGAGVAAALTIEGELKSGEKSEETSDVTFTYLPSQSERRGGLFFTKNPNDYELKLRAKGYEKP